MLIDFADIEWKGQEHKGEIPVLVINDLLDRAEKSFALVSSVLKNIKKDESEFRRLVVDMGCYRLLSYHFIEKVRAALLVLRYKYSGNIGDLENATEYLDRSVLYYRQLSALSSKFYLYANSMQTQQRKIPMRGVDGTYKHWKEMLPVFEAELNTFKHKIDSLKRNTSVVGKQVTPFPSADVRLNEKAYTVDVSSSVFDDTSMVIKSFAPELKGLKGLQQLFKQQQRSGNNYKFYLRQTSESVGRFFQNTKSSVYNRHNFFKRT
jgi:hypothetical protein